MAFLNNKNIANNLEAKYKNQIGNIMLVVAFTAINLVMLLTNAGSYFLFSAFLPYYIVDYGMFWCGYYGAEIYEGIPEIEFMEPAFLVFTVVIAAVMIFAYLICWLIARKKKIGALIAALVFFVIDTVAMLLIAGIAMDSIMDLVFHIWVIVSLSMGISTYFKMKKEEPTEVIDGGEQNFINAVQNDGNAINQIPMYSNMLRPAEECNSRVFIEEYVEGMQIICRRVKHTNELIINGCVYDEYVGAVEFAHTLSAYFNGHKVECVFDGISSIKLFVDSQEIAKKIRLI